MKISIITPTYPHDHCRLREQCAALAPQMDIGDEHLVYADGPFPWAERLVEERFGATRFVETAQTRQNGNAQREQAIRDAQGEVLYFLDDSMLPTPDALEIIRRRATERRPHLFRVYMLGCPDRVLGEKREWRLGSHDVNAAMLVTPNDKERLGSWHLADQVRWQDSPYGYQSPRGDEWHRAGGYFLAATIEKYPEGPVWCEEYISMWFE